MPTHKEEPSFLRDYARLTPAQRLAFAVAINHMVDDMKAGQGFRKGLGIKGVQGHPGIYEVRWADDGRATFSYGTSPYAGDTHIIWRHIGTHDILQNP
jgi:hypothetical protein